ncbi:tRNA pseudouridine(38-40) synthase TruA [Eubacteriales bacterium KG127]
MKNILIVIEYDGSGFSGWQRQPNVRTVQGTLEKVISAITSEEINLRGVSRTDAGVHAHHQMAQFKCNIKIPTTKIAEVINNALAKEMGLTMRAPDIRVKSAMEVPGDFDVRKAVFGKKYSYYLCCSNAAEITLRNCRYFVDEEINFDAIRQASKLMIGKKDFSSFRAAGGDSNQDPNKTIFSIEVNEVSSKGDKYAKSTKLNDWTARIDFYGDSFMYNQVRIMVGTLLDVGRGRITVESISSIIEAGDRSKAGHTAPAQGLFLEEMYFSKDEIEKATKYFQEADNG